MILWCALYASLHRRCSSMADRYISTGSGNGNRYALGAVMGVVAIPFAFIRVNVPPQQMIFALLCVFFNYCNDDADRSEQLHRHDCSGRRLLSPQHASTAAQQYRVRRALGMFCLTRSLIPKHSWGWDVAWRRTLLVVVGLAGAAVMMVLPPQSGHVMVRKSAARCLGDIMNLYELLIEGALCLKCL